MPDGDLELRPATPEDVDDVLALAASCANHMIGRGILQWDDLYPDRDSIESDIREGGALLARHGDEVVAYFALDSRQDPQYAQVAWRFTQGPVAVVHRLMVSPEWQGRGLGRWLMDVAEQRAQQSGCATMRLEAFTNNPGAMRLYEKCGYRAAGIVHFRPGEFTCLEKALSAPASPNAAPQR